MADPNPIKDEELYNSVILGNEESPGTVKLSGHDRKVNWDVKAGQGQAGATTTLKDIPPIEFTLTFYLADLADFENWSDFATLLLSTVSGKKPKALDIYHPDLAANGISSVVLANLGGVVHDGKGGQTIVVKLQEYKPPKPKGGSPSGSSTSKKKAADPNQAALDELAELTFQYQKTNWDGTKNDIDREKK